MSKQIEIVVAPDGRTRLETKGFNGSSCQDASRFMEQALGRINDEQRTAEFFTPASTGNRLQQNNGG